MPAGLIVGVMIKLLNYPNGNSGNIDCQEMEWQTWRSDMSHDKKRKKYIHSEDVWKNGICRKTI